MNTLFSSRDLGPPPSPFLGLEQFVNFDLYPNFRQSVEMYEKVVHNNAIQRKRQSMEKVHCLTSYEEYWRKHLLDIIDTHADLHRPYICCNHAYSEPLTQEFHECMDEKCPIHPDKNGKAASIAHVSEDLVDSDPQFLCSKLKATVDIGKYPAYRSSVEYYNIHIKTLRTKENVQLPGSYHWLSPNSRHKYNEENDIADKRLPPMQGLRRDINTGRKEGQDISDLIQKYDFLFDPLYIYRSTKTEEHSTSTPPILSKEIPHNHQIRNKTTGTSKENSPSLIGECDTNNPETNGMPHNLLIEQRSLYPKNSALPQFSKPDFNSHLTHLTKTLIAQVQAYNTGMRVQELCAPDFGKTIAHWNNWRYLMASSDCNAHQSHIWNNLHTTHGYTDNGWTIFRPECQKGVNSRSTFYQSDGREYSSDYQHQGGYQIGSESLFSSEIQQDAERVLRSSYVNSGAEQRISSHNRHRSRSRSSSKSSGLSTLMHRSPDVYRSLKHSERHRDRHDRHSSVRERRTRSPPWKHYDSANSLRRFDRRQVREPFVSRKDRSRQSECRSSQGSRNSRDFQRSRESRGYNAWHSTDEFTKTGGSRYGRVVDYGLSRRGRGYKQEKYRFHERAEYRNERHRSTRDYSSDRTERKKNPQSSETLENYRTGSRYLSRRKKDVLQWNQYQCNR